MGRAAMIQWYIQNKGSHIQNRDTQGIKIYVSGYTYPNFICIVLHELYVFYSLYPMK